MKRSKEGGRANWDEGQRHTEETKKKISEANTGRRRSGETKRKIAEATSNREGGQVKRFWLHIDKKDPDECWNWTRYTAPNGYGRVKWNGLNGALTHRVVWELTYGPIPEKLFVLHKCDNRKCCNPEHLFLGTQATNMKDMTAKGRRVAAKGYIRPDARGELNNLARLTQNDVREIRRLATMGTTQKKLARTFYVSTTTINNVVLRKTWKHIE